MKNKRSFVLRAATLAFGAIPFAGTALASGFALIEQNADGLGNAYAGAAARAEDASTVYFNPAGLTRIRGRQIVVSGHLIRPSVKFSDGGSKTAGGTPLTGNDGGDAGGVMLVPNVYYAADLGKGLKFGLGINSPFGLSTDYDSGWKGRYFALDSELLTVNINPALAYRVNDAFSVGAGIDLQYAKAKLSNAVDFGTICVGVLGPATCGSLGLTPQNADGKAEVSGDDWAVGYNFGLLFAPSAVTRVGLAYRSKISHELTGDIRFSKPASLPAALAGSPVFSDAGAKASLTLPESLSLSAYHELNRKWAVMADITRTRWSRFNELRVRFDNGAPDSVTEENWKDTNRYALGVNYRFDETWLFRAGLAYDESPVPDASRTPRIPDGDRTWVTVGAGYRMAGGGMLNAGYAHLFVKDVSLRETSSLGTTLAGSYDNQVDILSLQYTRSF